MSRINYFTQKKFIKATDNLSTSADPSLSESQSKVDIVAAKVDGEDTRKFYDSLFSSSSDDDEVQIISVRKITKRRKSYSYRDLFLAVENDSEDLEDIVKSGIDVNVMDSYGWTPLMHASCSGKAYIANILLQYGADLRLSQDKAGWTCESLICKDKGDFKTANELRDLFLGLSNRDDALEINEEENAYQTCDLCDEAKVNKATHPTSVIHNFRHNLKPDNVRPINAMYGISCRNRGYRLMLKKGWDPERGLGPEGEGKLYPVKTILKRDRLGIGRVKERARVTHFGPGDVSSVQNKKNPPKKAYLTKKKIIKKLEKEKCKDLCYRQELNEL